MCQRALKLRNEVTHLMNTEPELETNQLTYNEWRYLNNITKFLKPFRTATKVNEGILDIIDRMLPSLKFLIEHLKQARLNYTGNLYMRERVERAWEKLDKYYSISDKLIVYIGATVLNPLFKW